MDKFLFGSIGVLLVAIVSIGAYSAVQHPSETQKLLPTAVSAVQEAASSAASGVASDDASVPVPTSAAADESSVMSRDRDGDSDDGENERDDDNDTINTSAVAPAKTSSQTSAPAPAKSPSSTYTMAQVKAHNSASSCYTTINGSVYDLTSFINQHPGGSSRILRLCGIDGAAQFEAQHGGQGRPEQELASLKIGTLAK